MVEFSGRGLLLLGGWACLLGACAVEPVSARPSVRVALDETLRSVDARTPTATIVLEGPQASIPALDAVLSHVTLTNRGSGQVTPMTAFSANAEATFHGSVSQTFTVQALPPGEYLLSFELADWGVPVEAAGFDALGGGVFGTVVYLVTDYFQLRGALACSKSLLLTFTENFAPFNASELDTVVMVTVGQVPVKCAVDPSHVFDGRAGGSELQVLCEQAVAAPFGVSFPNGLVSVAGRRLGRIAAGTPQEAFVFSTGSASANGCTSYAAP
jgi:hypothetical protein